MVDKDDLSRFMGRQRPFRRKRVSTGEMAGIPLDEVPKERLYCKNERKFIKFKHVYTVWEFGPGVAFRMRFCQWCDYMIQETEFDLSRREACPTVIDVANCLKDSLPYECP